MRQQSSDDGYDWPWLFYVGMTVLLMKREEILKCTPRELQSYLRIHKELNSKKDKDNFKFVDQL